MAKIKPRKPAEFRGFPEFLCKNIQTNVNNGKYTDDYHSPFFEN